jgi:hypothetical protein
VRGAAGLEGDAGRAPAWSPSLCLSPARVRALPRVHVICESRHLRTCRGAGLLGIAGARRAGLQRLPAAARLAASPPAESPPLDGRYISLVIGFNHL